MVSLIQSAVPNANFFQKSTTNFSVPWISLSSGLNIIVTALIAGRILYVRYKYGRVLSQASGHSTFSYTGVVAILVESALPLSIVGIIFSIFLSKGLSSAIFLAVTDGACIVSLMLWAKISAHDHLIHYQALAPQLIILRVAMGQAWERNTLTEVPMAPIIFANTGSSTIMHDVRTSRVQRSNPDMEVIPLEA